MHKGNQLPMLFLWPVAIGMWACFEIDEGRSIPEPVVGQRFDLPADSVMALVDIDIDAYRS